MRETEIPCSIVSIRKVETVMEHAIFSAGLRITLRTSLRKFPRCVHWHIKNGGLAGTLEFTFWPEERRAWFSVQQGRKAKWIEAALPRLAQEIEMGIEGF